MSIIYRPNAHRCQPPPLSASVAYRYPQGTIWRCDECGVHRVSSRGAWCFPFGPTARRIKRLERGAA